MIKLQLMLAVGGLLWVGLILYFCHTHQTENGTKRENVSYFLFLKEGGGRISILPQAGCPPAARPTQ
jgi:hypothetical protein